MEPLYYIYSIRMQGWVTRGGLAHSDYTKGQKFTYDDAVAYCVNQRDWNKAVLCFPVAEGDLTRISQ